MSIEVPLISPLEQQHACNLAAKSLARQVGIIFFRSTQTELFMNPNLPNPVLGKILDYADSFQAAYPHAPTFADMALELERRSHTPDEPIDDTSEISNQIAQFTHPLTKLDTYFLFKAQKLTHPRSLWGNNLRRIKALFYLDLINNKLNNPQSEKLPNVDHRKPRTVLPELLATNFLFSYGREALIASGLEADSNRIDQLEQMKIMKGKLYQRWKKLADKKNADNTVRGIAQQFVELYDLEPDKMVLPVKPESTAAETSAETSL